MARKLVIDGQLFQTPAWHRGMGKYSIELLAALSGENSTWDSIDLILSKNLTNDPLLARTLKDRLPDILVNKLPLIANTIGDETVPDTNREIINNYLDPLVAAGDQVDYLVLSLMQGEIYPTFPSSESINKLVLVYDLIPLMFHEIYLQNPITRVEYLSKIKELLNADTYLCISKTVANDLGLYLGVETARITSIDGGPIAHAGKSKPYDKVKGPFVLMPTGNDLRKNNNRAILGFKDFNERHNNQFSLVITSFFKDFEMEELSKLCDKVIFTGNVSGENLRYLYEEASVLLFPSEYEGLGLPILEALEFTKPIVCSDIAVFREISQDAFHFCDPYLTSSITDLLHEAITHPRVDARKYKEIEQRYTWQETAKKTITTLKAKHDQIRNADKRRIAVYGPDPAQNTMVSKFMIQTHATQSRYCNADYYISGVVSTHEPRVNFLPYIARTRLVEPGIEFSAAKYEAIIYHFADDASLGAVLLTALSNPGVAVLHDVDLADLWDGATRQGYIDKSRLSAETQLNDILNIKGASYIGSIVASQRTIIVFSDFAYKVVKEVAKSINSKAVIKKLSCPINSLVYPKIVPTKSSKITLTKGNYSTVGPLSDFRSNELVSRAQSMVVPAAGPQYVGLEAMAFAVAIVACENTLFADFPKETAIVSKDNEENLSKIQSGLTSSEIQSYAKTGQAYVKANHEPILFAEAVYQSIRGADGGITK